MFQGQLIGQGIGNSNAEETSAMGCQNTIWRIFKGDSLLRIYVQGGKSGKVGCRIRLATLYIVKTFHAIEIVQQRQAGEMADDPLTRPTGGDGQLEAQALRCRDVIQNTGQDRLSLD